MRSILCFAFYLLGNFCFAQNKQATVSGIVTNQDDIPLVGVTINRLGKNLTVTTNDSGKFSIQLPAEQALALVFSHTGFANVQKNFFLSKDENEFIIVRLQPSGKTLDEVVVQDESMRNETGKIVVNPKTAILIPSTTGGVEALVKTLVGSNNELTSQYNVRGGNFDENLVYINGFEVYRPFLVSSGQQEGLSLINPQLTKTIQFYTGGYQAKYGDKMSSVLDIQYKTSQKFGGSAYLSLLEQGAHLEGKSKKNNLRYLMGLRNKSNRGLLSNQATKGSYIPSANDAQGLIQWQASNKVKIDFLGIYSNSKFNFEPEEVKKTAAVFSPFYTANIGLDVNFEGQENDQYKISLLGTTITHQINNNFQMKWQASRFKDKEQEHYDIAGTYLFGERDFDQGSSTFGEIINPMGAGYYQNFGRNNLEIDVWNFSNKSQFKKGNHFFQFGIGVDQSKIKDAIHQFEYQDSAGYSLPYFPGMPNMTNVINNDISLNRNIYSGFLQDNFFIPNSKSDISLQAGVRYNVNSLNKESLISPRAQITWKPKWKSDMVFKIAAGKYDQPPFYRELRLPNGSIDKNMKAQKSWQFVFGNDYQFIGMNNSPMRLSTEIYYKKMTDVIPFDIDNVKIKYLGSNNAKAYSTGIEMRLFGELTKGAQSWISLGLMKSRENLNNDFYYRYFNAAGEEITWKTVDKIVTDSLKTDVGWVRRPNDRLITAGLYIEDYLATNKNFKFFLNLIYGSNMSFNVPQNPKFRNALRIEPYIRADVGFSYLLMDENSIRRSHSPFRNFENIWMSLEVYNLINRYNTISYQMIKDFSNTSYALPNRLTPRLLNLKIVAKF